MAHRYPFRRDSGEVVWVDFETMMESSGSFLELDGESLRRAYDLENHTKMDVETIIPRASMLSDSMGFTKLGLQDRVDHLKQSGIRGVEFKEDRDVPGFFQVQCDSEKSKMAYARSLGMADRNSLNGSGAMLSPEQIQGAKELVLRR